MSTREGWPSDDWLQDISPDVDDDDIVRDRSGPKIASVRFEFDPSDNSYWVQEFYRDGSRSERRRATEQERKQYLLQVSGPSVVGRLVS